MESYIKSVCFLLLFFTSHTLLALAPNELVYHITLLDPTEHSANTNPPPTFEITLEFNGHNSGQTTLILPEKFKQQENLEQFIEVDNTVTSIHKALMFDSYKKNLKTITHVPNQTLTLRYQLRSALPATPPTPPTPENYLAPIITASYFHTLGEALWVIPEHLLKKPDIKVTLNWTLPEHWALANSFGVNQRTHTIETSGARFKNSLYLGGNFTLREHKKDNQTLWYAIQGSFSQFNTDEFTQSASRLILSQRAFFKQTLPFFLLSVLPIDSPQPFSTHEKFTDTFAFFLSPEIPFPAYPLSYHHFQYGFNTQRFSNSLAWLTSGFNEYYAWLFLAKEQFIDFEDYLQQANDVIIKYLMSNQLKKSQPKRVGELLAYNWNAQIRSRSNNAQSLDDLIHDLLNQTDSPISLNTILTVGKRYIPGNLLAEEIQRFVQHHAPMKPNPLMLGPCARPIFKRGNTFPYIITELKDTELPQFERNPELRLSSPQCLSWFNHTGD